MASLDQSLRRMHIDYVDLFYSHRFDPNTPIEETAQALVDIVRSGKALYAGISNWPLEPLKIAERYLREHDVPLLIYQGRLNMIDRVPQETGITAFCKEQGIGFISYSPLAQGLLTDRYLNGIPQDSRMARNSSLPKERLTPELLSQLNGWQQEAVAQGQTMAEGCRTGPNYGGESAAMDFGAGGSHLCARWRQLCGTVGEESALHLLMIKIDKRGG